MSANFFAQPLEKKAALEWTTPQANRGYVAHGREKVSQLNDAAEVEKIRSAVPDLKESFEIGRDDEAGHPNNWPEEQGAVTGFKEDMKSFFQECKALHVEVMRAIATGMSFEETFFDRFLDVGDNTLRLLHYPEVRSDVFNTPGQVRAGEHSVRDPEKLYYTTHSFFSNVFFYAGLWVNHITLPRQPRRPASQESKWEFYRRNSHREHHRCQRRRLAGEMEQ